MWNVLCLTPGGTAYLVQSIGQLFTTSHRAMFKLGAKHSFFYVSRLRIYQLFTVLTGVIFESMKVTVPGMETISTRAELKGHSILNNLAISDLQIITSTGRS